MTVFLLNMFMVWLVQFLLLFCGSNCQPYRFGHHSFRTDSTSSYGGLNHSNPYQPLVNLPSSNYQPERYGHTDRIDYNQAPIIKTSLGLIKGSITVTSHGFRMLTYLSVPYAETPIRFAKPIGKKSWSNVHDSSNYAMGCSTVNHIQQEHSASVTCGDDCHFLKIVIPAERSGPLPVIFWIPGGGFNGGANRDYDLHAQGDNLVATGVILVQPNYRLGPLGFWSIESDHAPGNMALWDCLEALKFVKREIAAFGGDSNHILIMGQGAGAIAASALTLSPLAHGLYHRSALLSGNMWSPKVHVRPEIVTKRNKLFAAYAGCDDHNNTQWLSERRHEILQCMRHKSTTQLLLAAKKAGLHGPHDWFPRIPDGQYGILPHSLHKLARLRPPLPVLQGTSKHETSWDMLVSQAIFGQNSYGKLAALPDLSTLNTPKSVVKQCKKYVSENYYSDATLVQALCITRYVDYHTIIHNSTQHRTNQYASLDRRIDRGYASKQLSSINDPLFWLKQSLSVGSVIGYQAPAMLDMTYHMAQGNCHAYLYSFDYVRAQAGDWWKTVGAFHNMDILFLENFLLDRYGNFTFDHQDLVMQKVLIDMITNFAKSGNPTPHGHQPFKPLTLPSDFSYYSVAYPTSQMKPCYHQDDVLFWKQAVPLTIRDRENDILSIPLIRGQCDKYVHSQHQPALCKPYSVAPKLTHSPSYQPTRATTYSISNSKPHSISGYETLDKTVHQISGYENLDRKVHQVSGYERLGETISPTLTGYENVVGHRANIEGPLTNSYQTNSKPLVHQQSVSGYEQLNTNQLQQHQFAKSSLSGYEHLNEHQATEPYDRAQQAFNPSEHRLPTIIHTPNYLQVEESYPRRSQNFFTDTRPYEDQNRRDVHVYKFGLDFGDLVKSRSDKLDAFLYGNNEREQYGVQQQYANFAYQTPSYPRKKL